MVTRAQEMAAKRIEQIESEMQMRMRALDSLERDFEVGLAEVTKLVQEHCLDKQFGESFRERVTKSILAEAEKRKEYAWAANFAKKCLKE